MSEKRTSQGSAMNYGWRIDGNGCVRKACSGCPEMNGACCRNTGEKILYPATGPVGLFCPLPRVEPPEDGE